MEKIKKLTIENETINVTKRTPSPGIGAESTTSWTVPLKLMYRRRWRRTLRRLHAVSRAAARFSPVDVPGVCVVDNVESDVPSPHRRRSAIRGSGPTTRFSRATLDGFFFFSPVIPFFSSLSPPPPVSTSCSMRDVASHKGRRSISVCRIFRVSFGKRFPDENKKKKKKKKRSFIGNSIDATVRVFSKFSAESRSYVRKLDTKARRDPRRVGYAILDRS